MQLNGGPSFGYCHDLALFAVFSTFVFTYIYKRIYSSVVCLFWCCLLMGDEREEEEV